MIVRPLGMSKMWWGWFCEIWINLETLNPLWGVYRKLSMGECFHWQRLWCMWHSGLAEISKLPNKTRVMISIHFSISIFWISSEKMGDGKCAKVATGDDYFELMMRNAWHIAGGLTLRWGKRPNQATYCVDKLKWQAYTGMKSRIVNRTCTATAGGHDLCTSSCLHGTWQENEQWSKTGNARLWRLWGEGWSANTSNLRVLVKHTRSPDEASRQTLWWDTRGAWKEHSYDGSYTNHADDNAIDYDINMLRIVDVLKFTFHWAGGVRA